MSKQTPLPGTLVRGPFFSDGGQGLGVVVARGNPLWTRVPEGYVGVNVIVGDRIPGGYKPEGLTTISGWVLVRTGGSA